MQKRTRRALIWLALIFAVGVGAVVVIGMTASRRDSAAARRLREHGQAAVARYEAQFPGEKAPVQPTPGASAESDVPSAAPSTEEEEDRASASPAAFILFEKLRQEIESLEAEEDQDLQKLLEKDWSEWTEDDFRRLAEFMGPHADLVEEIRRLARLGEPVYRVDLSEGYEAELPHLAPLRNMARLLSRDAALRVRAGDLEGAMEDYRAIIGLSETLVEEPLIISQLVRIAMTQIMFESMGTVLPPGQVSFDEARAFVAETADLYHREALVDALLAETTFGFRVMGEYYGGAEPVAFDISDSTVANMFLSVLYDASMADIMLTTDQQDYSEFMERLSEAAKAPYYETWRELEAIEADLDDASGLLAPVFVVALTRIPIAQARNEAMLDLVRIGLSLEVQYAETGSYPDNLNAVARNLGGTVPVDPFTGESYVYKPDGDTFTLYSVGQNEQDDGGRFNYREGDIVWRGVKEKLE